MENLGLEHIVKEYIKNQNRETQAQNSPTTKA